MIDLAILQNAVMESRDGITISDARADDNPLIFVNPAFERMTGYSSEEAINRNCRYLQGTDREQAEVPIIKRALEKGDFCLVTLRNYRKDGSMFWNELSISPIHDEQGELTHFIGIQKDVTDRTILSRHLQLKTLNLETANKKLAELANTDALTGIYNRRFFEHQLRVQWNVSLRNQMPISLFMVDVDHFKAFNDHYGHQAGDTCLRQVAQVLNRSFRRASDFVARFGGEEFVVLATTTDSAQAYEFAERLRADVQALSIPHTSSSSAPQVTVSIGFATLTPAQEVPPEELLKAADEALYQAKQQGRNRVIQA